jgi:alpha-methylacyl-CoA racemase
MLGDLGAEVIRLERVGGSEILPEALDPARRAGGFRLGIDLKDAEGLVMAKALIESADVLIEAFRPGVAERLGIGPDEFTERHPMLIYARMTGWGQTGPLAAEVGHDINYVGLTGALHATGRAGDRPVPAINLVGDYGGGALYLVVGVLAALRNRDQTGRGEVLDVAMVDGVAALLGPTLDMLESGFWIDDREANLLDGGAPFYTTYETADGRYVAVGALEPAFYSSLVAGLDLTGVDLPDRRDRSRWPQLREVFASRFATRTRDEWTDHFSGTDACVTPVLALSEARVHPHLIDRGTFVQRAGKLEPGPAPRFESAPAATREAIETTTPTEILAAAGIAPERVAAAVQAGIVD